MSDSPVKELFADLEAERSAAQRAVFDHYYQRIVGLLRAKIDGHLKRRFDASDIANSAFRSFFLHAKAGHFNCQNRPQLWRLLVTITMNKLRSRIRFHKAQRRSLDRETEVELPQFVESEPLSEDLVVLSDELEATLSRLKPYYRDIAERILAGQSNTEIASQTQRSTRTVRRIVLELENRLVERFHLSQTANQDKSG